MKSSIVARNAFLILFMKLLIRLFLIATLFFSTETFAASVRITKNNIKDFFIISKRSPFPACYKVTFGKLKENKIKVGGIFSTFSEIQYRKKIQSLEQKIKRTVNNRKKRILRKELSSVKKELQILLKLQNRCLPEPTPSPIPEGGFSGNPNSLAAYHENLTAQEIEHILSRVALGGSTELRIIAKNQGLSALVDALVDGVTDEGPSSTLGQTVQQIISDSLYHPEEDPSRAIWHTGVAQNAELYRMLYSRNPLHEWMVVNLSQHFATSLSRSGSYSAYEHYAVRDYYERIRAHAVGNFSLLTQEFLTDSAMNIWLDNKDNHVGSPNQNFARELLELFILGAIDPVTKIKNYDERTVQAATAFVSGYQGDEETIPSTGETVFKVSYNQSLHDDALYSVFHDHAGETNSSFSPEAFIQYTFSQNPASARYVAERLAGKILYPGLQEGVVSELAQTLRQANFELKPFLRKILKSQAMFSMVSKDSCIQSPLEKIIRFIRKIAPEPIPYSGENKEKILSLFWSMINDAGAAGQFLFDPPSVFGWKGACNINRNGVISTGEGWMQGQRILARANACTTVMNYFNWIGLDFVRILGIDGIKSTENLAITLGQKGFAKNLLPSEVSALAYYLSTTIDDNNQRVSWKMSLDDEYYVRVKITGALCALYAQSDTNLTS